MATVELPPDHWKALVYAAKGGLQRGVYTDPSLVQEAIEAVEEACDEAD